MAGSYFPVSFDAQLRAAFQLAGKLDYPRREHKGWRTRMPRSGSRNEIFLHTTIYCVILTAEWNSVKSQFKWGEALKEAQRNRGGGVAAEDSSPELAIKNEWRWRRREEGARRGFRLQFRQATRSSPKRDSKNQTHALCAPVCVSLSLLLNASGCVCVCAR